MSPTKDALLALLLFGVVTKFAACQDSPESHRTEGDGSVQYKAYVPDTEAIARLVAREFERLTVRDIDDDLVDAWVAKVIKSGYWSEIEASRFAAFPADEPVFDNTWWPEGLRELGVPRPDTLDERVRESWEWAAEMHRHAQAYRSNAVSRNDPWPALATAIDGYWTFREAERAVVRGWPGIDRDSEQAAFAFARSGCDSSLAATLDHLPELRTRLINSHEALDGAMAEPFRTLLRAHRSSSYAPPVPLIVSDVRLWLRRQMHAGHLLGYLNATIQAEIRDEEYFAAANRLAIAYTIGTGLSHVPTISAGNAGSRAVWSQDVFTREMVGRTLSARLLQHLEEITNRFNPAPLSFSAGGSRITLLAGVDQRVAELKAERGWDAVRTRLYTNFSQSFGLHASRGTLAALFDIYEDAFSGGLQEDARIDSTLAASVFEWFHSEHGEQELRRRFNTSPILLGNARGDAHDLRARAFGYRDAFRIMLAIERHRNREGTLPATLDELDVEASILFDRLSESHFRYVRDHPESPVGEGFASGYLLYSIGADGVDNNGLQTKNLDARYYAMRREWGETGYDFVYNQPAVAQESSED